MASALAPSVPTRRQISRPGPTVTAIASTSAAERRPARSSASATVVASAASCASRATPGTTPPHSSCRAACEASASPRMAPSLRTTATPVSSQLVSMPSTVNGAPPAAGSGRVPATRNPESRVGPRSTALGSPTCARDAAALQQTTDPPRRQGAAARRGKAATPAVQASAESSTRDVGSRDICKKPDTCQHKAGYDLSPASSTGTSVSELAPTTHTHASARKPSAVPSHTKHQGLAPDE